MGKKSQDILFLDTETTGLPEALGTDLHHMPYITEICIIRTNKKLVVQQILDTLIDVPVEIEPFITKHTGISNALLTMAGAKPFAKSYKAIKAICKGAGRLVAQNLPFDDRMLEIDSQRVNKKTPIPKGIDRFCTVEQSKHIWGIRMNSKELYKLATGKEIVGIHRARVDVEAMIQYYRMIAGGSFPEHLRI